MAGNLSGPLRHRFGAPRDLVLGATLVLGDGTVASAGGKVVKNVAGYDLARLVCGSEGRLAFVARVSLRLHPLPAGDTDARRRDGATRHASSSQLQRSQLQPSALDVLHPGRVAALFEGSPRAVAAQLEAARRLVGGAEADGAVWDESRTRQAAASGRVRFAPGDLAAVLANIEDAVVRPAAGVAYTAASSASCKLLQVPSESAARVADRITRELDPHGVLT